MVKIPKVGLILLEVEEGKAVVWVPALCLQ
jgi:hypothetical protein